MTNRNGMHSDKRSVITIEHWPFSRYAIDWIGPVEHHAGNLLLFTRAHAQLHRPDEGGRARPDVLNIDGQNIEPVQHFRCWFAMFPVQAVNRYAQTRMIVTFPLHHVVLRLAEKSVLWPKEGRESKHTAIVSLQNSRRVFKLRGDRCRMNQRADTCPAEFVRPKFVQMIDGQYDGHSAFLLQHRNSREQL